MNIEGQLLFSNDLTKSAYVPAIASRVWSWLITNVLLVAALAVPASSEQLNQSAGQLAPLERFRDCEQCPELVVMPLGSFMMGAKPGESRNPFDIYGPLEGSGRAPRIRAPDEINIIPNEHPRHRVEIDIPFAIGRNEVTHAEWMACVDAGGCTHTPDHRARTPGGYKALGPDHPVINVSYLDGVAYVAWLNALIGADLYRLPTEAEWEYAARAGTETRFAQGDELSADQANFSRSATEHVRGRGPHLVGLKDRRVPVPVDELDAANGWGVRHMSGNVNEFTMSCWSDRHLGLQSSSAYVLHAEQEGSCRRVAKGGGFGTAMDGLRPSSRTRPAEDRRRYFRGFRVLREIQFKEQFDGK